MPKNEIDYSNTIIYKITCKNTAIKDLYVGHTTNFVQRKHAHKQSCINNKSPNHESKLYQAIRKNEGWDNWNMEIINFFNCADHYEARIKEQEYFISLNANLNSIEPLPKPKIKNNITTPSNQLYFCNTCNINCTTPKIFDNHNKTNKHLKMESELAEKTQISNLKFVCECCDFRCCKKGDLNRHLLTSKHKKMNSGTVDDEKNINKCNKCFKVYKSRNGLWLHSKKCTNEIESNKLDINNSENMIVNSEVANLSKIVIELIKSNTDLQKQLLEVCKKIKDI
jgi:hypothetical protein